MSRGPSPAADAARVPVLLVPGWSDRVGRLRWLHNALLDAGWPASHVAALGFRNRFGGNALHSTEVAGAVQELLAATGCPRIDIVAHSMGGLAVRHFLALGDGARHVRRVVFTATPHAGTWLARLVPGGGAADMRPGSPFLRLLAEQPPLPPELQALCIHTPTDLRVLPHRSTRLPGTRCERVWCLSHAGMLRSRRVLAAIRAFLEE